MCHAGGLVFRGDNTIVGHYPPEHRLHAVAADPLARARDVMARYTSSPSFWGIYRRAAVDRPVADPLRVPAGIMCCWRNWRWPGEIRHVAAAAVLAARRRQAGDRSLPAPRPSRRAPSLPLDDTLAEQRWRTPLITTAYAHIEMAAATRLSHAERVQPHGGTLKAIFRARWLPLLIREAEHCAPVRPPRRLSYRKQRLTFADRWAGTATARRRRGAARLGNNRAGGGPQRSRNQARIAVPACRFAR